MKAKTAAILAAATLAGLSSCSSTKIQEDHWTAASIPGRVAYHATGYRGPETGTFFGHIGADFSSIGQTLARHFMNRNSENPYQGSTRYRTHSAGKPTSPEKFKLANDESPRRVFE